MAQQLMFFTLSIIVIISLELSQPQNLLPIIYTGSKPLLYQKLSLLHYKTAILMLQVEFIEKPYACISYKFEFLVFVYLVAGSKALGSHTSGSHTVAGQGGGVTEASGAAMRHNKPPNPLTGTSGPPPVDSNRLVYLIIIHNSLTI